MAAFKEQLDQSAVERIASSIAATWREFDAKSFVAEIAPGLGALELKARVQHIAEGLRRRLPSDLPTTLDILVASLGPPGAPSGRDFWGPQDEGQVTGFLVWPFTQLVQDHGLQHFEASMAALEQMTRRFTAEFALRPFAQAEPEGRGSFELHLP